MWTDFDIFGRNIKQPIQRRFTTSTQITCASALPGKTGKHENCIFHSNARIEPVAAWFLQSVWLMTHTHAAVWLPKSRNQCVQLGAVVGAWFRRNELDSAAAVGLCCMHNAPVCCLLGFLFLQGNAEALDKWGGKAKHRLIYYFLTNTSAKNCRNRIVYVNIIASQRSDVFWDTVYYFPPPEMDAKYCDERVCVFECLYVCLSSRISQKLYVKSSRNFHYVYAKVCIT